MPAACPLAAVAAGGAPLSVLKRVQCTTELFCSSAATATTSAYTESEKVRERIFDSRFWKLARESERTFGRLPYCSRRRRRSCFILSHSFLVLHRR